MKGLIYKDLLCVRKQLMILGYVVAGVFVVSIMYVLSARFGNIARAGKEMLEVKENNMTALDVKNLGACALVIFMLSPIAAVGDMVQVFVQDGKAGFSKLSGVLPVSIKKRVLARYCTIFALLGVGIAFDLLYSLILSGLTSLMSFKELSGVVLSGAAVMAIYSALVIFFCLLFGYGKEELAQITSIITLFSGVILLNLKTLIKVVKAVVQEEQPELGESLNRWGLLDFIKYKSHILVISAILVIGVSLILSSMLAEKKRGVI